MKPEDQKAKLTPDQGQALFQFFTEVGIIHQLSSKLLESHLPHNLTNTHFGILSHLSRRPGGETPLQLATAFQQPKTTMTHMLKVLEKNGFITVGPHPTDGRSKNVTSTEQAHRLLMQTRMAMAPDMAHLVSQIDPDMITQITPHLTQIREILDRARD
ncbi:MarR family transcriptional regulator [Amylibacter sp. IMCC11727]|uniref:MarR family winged helix-turn-helix transcriptional regulator n=1 Tax=Amylibacter sp. IMCC11727 TaxID=3039851 RepID=UPI00244E1941|nr:MarR family transcriptional regulator [Amylibacter sp. IMCC11727]WGI21477.1 MarR family transcriptional regulator [Amylibacter sp. IMCC11727]